METARLYFQSYNGGEFCKIVIRDGDFCYAVKPEYRTQDPFVILCCAVREFGEWADFQSVMSELFSHPTFRLRQFYLKRAMISSFFSSVPALLRRGAIVSPDILDRFVYTKDADAALTALVRAGLPIDTIGCLVDDEDLGDLSVSDYDKQLLLRRLLDLKITPIPLYRTSLSAVRKLPFSSWEYLPARIRRDVEDRS